MMNSFVTYLIWKEAKEEAERPVVKTEFERKHPILLIAAVIGLAILNYHFGLL